MISIHYVLFSKHQRLKTGKTEKGAAQGPLVPDCLPGLAGPDAAPLFFFAASCGRTLSIVPVSAPSLRTDPAGSPF